MAFRQPYRSGLRALAEGLLRKAQTERAYSEIERQLELHKGEIGANLVQGLSQNVQQGLQAFLPQGQDTTVAENIIKMVPGEIDQLRNSIASMRTAGASPQQIAQAEALLVQKQQIMTMPLDMVPGAYQQTVTGFVVPPVPHLADQPSARERAAGRGPQTLQSFIPGLTGSQAFTDAMAGGASADARLGIQDSVVSNLIPRLSFNPDDPSSIADAVGAMSQVEALSPDARQMLAPHVAAIRERMHDPDVQAIIARRERINATDDRIGEGRADLQDIEIQRAQEALNFALATHEPRVREVFRRLDDATQTRIGTALNTGVYAGLSNDEKKHLTTLLGIRPEGLEEWSRGQIARAERMAEYAEERERLAIQQGQINITIGGLNISEKLLEYPQRVWEMSNERRVAEHQAWLDRRTQAFAPMQDEQTMVDMVAGAISNNDVALLSHYIYALENGTPLGVQMLATMNPEALGELRHALVNAQRVEAMDMKRLEDDAEMRTLNRREAIARIVEMETLSPLRIEEAAMRHGLLPLELEALRQTYALDIAEAERDIRGLALNDANATIVTLGEIARAVPASYWDSPPPYVTRSLEALGLDPVIFRSISNFEEWLREEPLRKEAWNQIDLMIQSPPADDAAAALMMDSVEGLGFQLGLNAPHRAALMAAVASIWQEKDAMLRSRLAEMMGDALLDGTDVKRALDAFSSVSTSLRQQHETVERQRIVDAGCGRFIDLGVLDRPMLQWTPNLDQAAGGTEEGRTCGMMRDDYIALGERINNVNDIQERLANVLLNDYVPGVAPSNRTPTQSTDRPVPTADSLPHANIDWAGYGVSPQHSATFIEIERIFDTNREGAQQLFDQMVARYGEETVLAILAEMGIQ